MMYAAFHESFGGDRISSREKEATVSLEPSA